jgi:DNA replication protein DnaC
MCKDKPMFNRNIRNVSMMAVEDMGREPVEVMDYGNVTNPVIDLMEYRYNEQLFTVITTNLSPRQIAEKYGKRLADRFNEMFRKIIFKNGSYR